MDRRLRLLALALAALFALLATLQFAHAQAPRPFAAGDAKAGAVMHEKDCVACHVRRVGGDGSAMYTRADRRVTTPAKLKAQVAACNTQLGAGYFPEEEEHLSAYLDLQYYKFKD
ncbi:MAG TPA: cytochrome c [Casimicrobiaceae bacterium]|jgi:mono/diheme cytochrome c family protein|nr:cytochrome c [Casimicrobiaceae bacterium]